MKIKEIQKLLNENSAAIINNAINRFYLSGFRSSAGSIVITKRTATLLVDFRYFEKAQKTVTNMEVLLCRSLYCDIKEILKKQNIKEILIESAHTTVESLNSIKNSLSEFTVLTDSTLSDKLTGLRQIKTQNEIEMIKASQKITDKAFNHILNYIKIGITERDVALELEFFMRKEGSEGVAFNTIAVSGKNSSLPHGVPGDKPLKKGDFLTIDFGAVYGGYCSDMTRTIALDFVTDEQQRVYDIVLKAQLNTLNAIEPNKLCKDIDAIARNIIADNGHAEHFGHGLGHSIGLEVHESPSCNTRDLTLLKKGMTMTVEPGIYIPNTFGVRIEDMVVVTDNGCENLTQSPKELIIL